MSRNSYHLSEAAKQRISTYICMALADGRAMTSILLAEGLRTEEADRNSTTQREMIDYWVQKGLEGHKPSVRLLGDLAGATLMAVDGQREGINNLKGALQDLGVIPYEEVSE